MTYETEFPRDYWIESDIREALDIIDAEDISWHNDICPSYQIAIPRTDDTLRLWVDAFDPEERECGPDQPRFTVNRYDGGCSFEQQIIESNDFDAVYRAILKFLAGQLIERHNESENFYGSNEAIIGENNFFAGLERAIGQRVFEEECETFLLKATPVEGLQYGIEKLEEKS